MDPSRRELIKWTLADDGFRLDLSPRLPVAIGELIRPFAQPLVEQITETGRPSDVQSWSIHPGGTAVIRAAERALKLDHGALASSRKLFESLGNLSSPSALMVLALERDRCPPDTEGIMIGFGPGLALEGLVYRLGEKVPADNRD